MDNLGKIQKGDYLSLRKNEASRWAANDILRKGSQLNFTMQPGSGGQVPADLQDKLEQDAMKIQKMKMNLSELQGMRLNTPDDVKRIMLA